MWENALLPCMLDQSGKELVRYQLNEQGSQYRYRDRLPQCRSGGGGTFTRCCMPRPARLTTCLPTLSKYGGALMNMTPRGECARTAENTADYGAVRSRRRMPPRSVCMLTAKCRAIRTWSSTVSRRMMYNTISWQQNGKYRLYGGCQPSASGYCRKSHLWSPVTAGRLLPVCAACGSSG